MINTKDNSLEKIYNATASFLIPLDPIKTYRMIAIEGKNLIGARFATIFLAKKNKLVRAYSIGPRVYRLKLRKGGFTYTAFVSGKPAIVSIEEYRKVHPEVPRDKIKTIFNVPLVNQDKKTVGVLNLHSENEYPHPKKTLEILRIYGSLASMAIKKSQLISETQEALKARDLFISMAAHELRTPLTTMTGYAQLFRQKIAKNEMPKERWANIMEFETLRLRRLTNELLQIDQIKTNNFIYDFRYLSVYDVIKQACSDVKFRYKKHKFIIQNKLKDDVVYGDFDKLLQVFINILNNAAKFSLENKQITVFFRNSRDCINVFVKDEGIGILRKDMKNLFKEFFKGSNSKSEGIGMGLFISKKIIEDHKGKIQIGSKFELGTTVAVRLPKSKPRI